MEHINLKESMHTKNHIVNLGEKHGCTIGVEVRNVTTGDVFFTHHATRLVPAASSIKLFFAGALLDTMQKKNISPQDTLTVEKTHHVPGASILADLKATKMHIDDLLYLLLVHSDTSAQNSLQQFVSPEEVNAYIQKINCTDTVFVSKNETNENIFSVTTPHDAVLFMSKLWHREILTEENCTRILTLLSQSRHTHFGLRHLPTSLNMKNPVITERYSKAGKVGTAVNDTLLLKTPKTVLGIGVFIDNFVATENFNSVDNAGILLVSELTRDLFTEGYQRVENSE